jgi:hypothetical protein
MRSIRWIVSSFVIGAVFMAAIGFLWDSSAVAQRQASGPQRPIGTAATGRYQISAYAGQADAGVSHGCYIVDTRTGQVWYTRAGGEAEKVSDQLP